MTAGVEYQEAPPARTWGLFGLGRVRTVIAALIPVALLAALLSWALASPVGASPDEDYHLGSIWCAQGDRAGLCESTADPGVKRVPASVTKAAKCYAFDILHSGRCPDAGSQELTTSKRGTFNDHGYPPVFYLTMSVFVSQHTAASVLAMRAFNAVLFVGLLTALFLLLSPPRRGIVLWGGLIALVPFGMFIIPSVNPSGWAAISAVTLWLCLIGFYEAQTRGRMIGLGALATVATLMGAGARSDAATYSVLAMVVVVLLKAERTRAFWLKSILTLVLAIVCVVFFLTGSQGGVINPETAAPLSGRQTLALAVANLLQLPSLWTGTLGTWGLGWLDTLMPAIVWVPSVTLVAGVAFGALRYAPLRKALAVGLVGLALVAVPLYVLVHDRVTVGNGVQPRYIYPLILLFVGVCLWGLRRLGLGLSGVQLILIVGGLWLANHVALYTNLRRYVTGEAAQGLNLDAGADWWWHLPFGPIWVWVIGSLAFLAALAAAAVVSWPVGTFGLRRRAALA
ncbi:DUF2142 domain-containing protein [Leifsonia shinshuensis]|uniref:DUF2142 domain-containing protein n=1 Tax=Leifsonia shinshuensis TaxID=150026 RepID=UPI00285AEBD8|nr:DUF2142 domain-containing protein [Leifsonia shinshuensis]MDR6973261.1 hypothetical protein [Leifsonia shinshuensis]